LGEVVLFVEGRVARSDIPALCERVRGLAALSDCGQPIVCDVGLITKSDVVVVDALAQMQLAAQRRGRCIRVRCAPPELRSLLVLVGLDDVLPCSDDDGGGSGVEAGWQAEEWEQRLGVEEEVQADDPAL
jgi:ABC-type transporter Mla MlaB component